MNRTRGRGSKSIAAGLIVCSLLAAGEVVVSGCRDEGGRTAKAAARYRCAMHPWIVSAEPGKCPICGMDLVPFSEEANPTPGAAASPAPRPAGAVTLSPEAVRAVGVATEPVTRRRLSGEIRAVGSIEVDERRQARVAARVAGRIEKLYADFTGQEVRAGAPLYAIYSPELVATQREYLLAVENRQRLSGGTPEAIRAADELVAASRDRLRLWGVSADRIAALERGRAPELATTFASPISGVVLQKMAVQGQYVAEGTDLYLLADLSRLWLIAQIYEYELGRIRVGQPVQATVSALPGRTFKGRIAFVEPVLDRDTRSARVRIELPNPGKELKPGMFADAKLELPAGEALTVPRSAVIDTGSRKVVFVETGQDTFTPRDVTTGDASEDRIAVLRGLREGERVVSAGNFFVDSQAQLSGGASVQYTGALDVRATPAGPAPTPGGVKP